MKIGLKARFYDLDEVVKLQPDFVELQFSDADVDHDFSPKKPYPLPCFIHLPEIWQGKLIDVSSISNENQVWPLAESRKIVREIIRKSQIIFKHFSPRTPVFILHPGGMTYERDYEKNNKFRLEALAESMSRLRNDNVEILLENLPPYPWYFGGQWVTNSFIDTVEIDRFCKKNKSKICFDVSHSKLYCNFAGVDFFEQLDILKDHIAHIHIADATGVDGEGVQIGEGEIDFAKFFKKIKPYQGTIVNEVWQGHLNDFAGFKTANSRIKKYLKQSSSS